MTGCFYRRLGGDGDQQLFAATDFTRSNWDPAIQHGSPPLALLTKAVEGLLEGTGLRIGRVGLDILGPVPVGVVAVRTRVRRPGRRIMLLAAAMHDPATDRPVAQLSAWALATSDTGDVASDRYRPLVEGDPAPMPALFRDETGYFEAVGWRPQHGDPDAAGVWWGRPRVRTVDTEPDSPVVALAALVDSANGVGAVLDPRDFWFMNTDTVVHLHRLPTGTDFGLRARASIGPDGVGATTAELFDRAGFIGTSAQTLLVQRR